MSTSTDFLMGSGGTPSAFGKNDAVGYTVTGTIVSTEVRQQTDLDGVPLTWDNGDARMQLVVTLQTDIRDDTDDQGLRAVYVKGSKQAGSKSLHDAVRAAVQQSGAKGLEPGGTLTVSYIGSEPAKTRGYSDRKLWQATYAAPDRAAETGQYLGTVQGVPAPAPDWAQPAPTPAAAPAAVTPATPAPAPVAPAPAAPAAEAPADLARRLIGAGATDDIITGATGLDPIVITTIRQSMTPAA